MQLLPLSFVVVTTIINGYGVRGAGLLLAGKAHCKILLLVAALEVSTLPHLSVHSARPQLTAHQNRMYVGVFSSPILDTLGLTFERRREAGGGGEGGVC